MDNFDVCGVRSLCISINPSLLYNICTSGAQWTLTCHPPPHTLSHFSYPLSHYRPPYPTDYALCPSTFYPCSSAPTPFPTTHTYCPTKFTSCSYTTITVSPTTWPCPGTSYPRSKEYQVHVAGSEAFRGKIKYLNNLSSLNLSTPCCTTITTEHYPFLPITPFLCPLCLTPPPPLLPGLGLNFHFLE